MIEIYKSGPQNCLVENTGHNMINASDMAKPFSKNPADWFRLKSTRNFITGLSDAMNCPKEELVKRIKKNVSENATAGIWIHEDVALEFVRWLSPKFAVWNNRFTKAYMLNGKTNTNFDASLLPLFAHDSNKETELFDNAVDIQTKKPLYHDKVLQSHTLIPITVIAKELGMSSIALNRKLHEKKIIYKNDTHLLLYGEFDGKGYTGTKTALYIDSQGKYQSNIHTYWTEKGREFIHSLFRETKQIA